MKKLLLLIFFCFLKSYTQDARGAIGAKTTATKGVNRAVVIGVSQYIERDLQLKYAQNDAALFRQYLISSQTVLQDHLVYLENENATAIQIIRELSNLLKVSNTGDVVYFYFAGHGDVVDDFGDKEGFLLAADANANQEYYAGGVISLDLLNNKVINHLTQKGVEVVLVLDACHSGFIFEEGTQRNLGTLQAMFEKTTKILSCGPDELSYESGDIQHGYFTYYLVKGLTGHADADANNTIIYREIDDYLYDNVNATVTNTYKKNQTPVVSTLNNRASFVELTNNSNSIAFEEIDKQLQAQNTLASRGLGIQKNATSLLNDPLLEKFSQAINQNRLHSLPNSAYDIYTTAKNSNRFSEDILFKMQTVLLQHLAAPAQQLVNQYIANSSNLPNAETFSKQAINLTKCLALLDKDDLVYKNIQLNALLLEAYASIQTNNYVHFPSAKQKLKTALSIEPNAAYIHDALGTLYNKQHQYDSAFYHFNTAKKLISSWSTPAIKLSESYLDQNLFSQAKIELEKTLSLKGNPAQAYILMGKLNEKQGNYIDAESYYKKALAENENNATAMVLLSTLQKNKGNQKVAKEWLEKANHADTNVVTQQQSLLTYIQDHKLDNRAAELLFLNTIEKDPNNATYVYEYAEFLRQKKESLAKLNQALTLYDKAITLNPFYTKAYAGKGTLLMSKRKPKEAHNAFLQAIDKNTLEAEPYYLYANFLLQNNKSEEAKSYYVKAISKNDFYFDAYASLIAVYEKENHTDKAIQLLENSIAKYPTTVDFYRLLGNTYFSKGEYTKAILIYQKAIAIDQTYTTTYTNLGYSQLQNNNVNDAKHSFSKAATANPDENKTSEIASVILTMAKQKEQFGTPAEAKNMYKLAYEIDYTVQSGLPYATYLYLQEDSSAFDIIMSLDQRKDVLDWTNEVLDLLLKSAIDTNQPEKADIYYNAIVTRNKQPDKLLLGIYHIYRGNRTEGITLIKQTNLKLLQSSQLKEHYSQHTINHYILMQ